MPIEMPEDFARGPIGSTVAGRYRMTSVIGSGAQGLVCRAEDAETGAPVAIKIVDGADPAAVARFAREREVLALLEHSNVVRILDTVSENRAFYLVMELLQGKDLQQLLEQTEARNERLGSAEISRIVGPIVDTLDAAHARGILHRDLKPANIFVLDAGGVRLLDFGLCRLATGKPLTELGTVLGSPSYIAPEAWLGRPDRVGAAADIYALGVILFRMLAGRLPFVSDSVAELLRLATTAPRPSLAALRPELPKEIDAWVEQALAIVPDRRFRTVRALYNGLLAVTNPAGERAAESWLRRLLGSLFGRRSKPDPAAAWKARVRATEQRDPIDDLLNESYGEPSGRR